MANNRFKTENSLLVTGESTSQFDTQTLFNANVTVNSAVLIVNGALTVGNTSAGQTSDLNVTGNLIVAGNLQYTNTQITGDLRAQSDGLDLGNTTNRFDIFIREGIVYSFLNPASNTVGTTLGNATSRWVLTGNTMSLSGALDAVGNVTINTDAFRVNATGKQAAVNTSTYSGALNVVGGANVSGDMIATANVSGNLLRAGNTYIVTNTATINANTSIIVDQFANADMKAVKYLAHVQNSTTSNRYLVEIVGLNVNTSLLQSQYGEVNNAVLGVFNMAKVGANIQLSYIDTGANSVNTSTVTVIRTILT
jgi:hypothetical protein